MSVDTIVKLNELADKGEAGIKSCQTLLNTANSLANKEGERVTKNNKIDGYRATDKNRYSEFKSKFDSHYQDWEHRRGDFSSHNTKDHNEDFWSDQCEWRPGNGVCTAHVNTNGWMDSECQQQARRLGRPYSDDYRATGDRRGCNAGDFWDGCMGKSDDGYSRKQRWLCRRTDQSKNQANINWQNSKPNMSGWCKGQTNPTSACKDTAECNSTTIDWCTYSNSNDYPPAQSYPYDNTSFTKDLPNLDCCVNVNASAGDQENVRQSCQKTLDDAQQKLSSPPGPSPSPSPSLSPSPSPSPSLSTLSSSIISVSSSQSDKDKQMRYVMIAIIICILLFISISAIFILMDSDE
jgi:hypothetical protein